MSQALEFVPLALVLLLAGCAGWYLVLRARLAAGPAARLSGIGGWLLVVALIQGAGPLALALQTTSFLQDSSDLWATHSVALAGPAVLNIALLVFSIGCAFAFFRRKAVFPRLFVWQVWLLALKAPAILAWLALTAGLPLGPSIYERGTVLAVPGGLVAVVWTLYALRSVRVRNTFVN